MAPLGPEGALQSVLRAECADAADAADAVAGAAGGWRPLTAPEVMQSLGPEGADAADADDAANMLSFPNTKLVLYGRQCVRDDALGMRPVLF